MTATDHMVVTRTPKNIVTEKGFDTGDQRRVIVNTRSHGIKVAHAAEQPDPRTSNATLLRDGHWYRIRVDAGVGIWFWSDAAGEHSLSIEGI